MTVFFKKAARALPLALAILAVSAALYALSYNAKAQSVYDTFPDEPFNGMQI
jgi:hypothetical protein